MALLLRVTSHSETKRQQAGIRVLERPVASLSGRERARGSSHATPPPSLMPQHKRQEHAKARRHEHRLQRLGTNGVF